MEKMYCDRHDMLINFFRVKMLLFYGKSIPECYINGDIYIYILSTNQAMMFYLHL